MQGELIAVGVEHHRAVAVRADGVHAFEYLAAVRLDLLDGVLNATVCVQVDQDAAATGLPVSADRLDQAAAVARAVIDHRELEVVEALLSHRHAEHRRVNGRRPIQFGDRDVEPDGSVGFFVGFAYERVMGRAENEEVPARAAR